MNSNRRRREAASGILFIAPSFLFLLAFFILPIFMSFYYSFTSYNVMSAPIFLGLDNYRKMLTDPFVKSSLINTIIYTFTTVPVQSALALLFAVWLANHFRGAYGGFVKSALFVPVIATSVLVGTLFVFMLATDEGAVNALITALGGTRVNWMGTLKTALPSVCMAAVWKNVGYFLVIFYAGIMDIPASLFEAARVDGGSPLQQFLHITLPALKPVMFLVVVLGTIWSFQVFDLVYAMTNGGPGRATVTLVLTIYKTAFKQYKMGYACAISMLLFLIITLLSMLQKRMFREE